MRRILCFGDSNTYGHSPDGTRYDESVSWPGVLATMLGDKFEVVTEAKNGRTVAFDDPYMDGCNGMSDIEECLERHAPIDLIIIMLGTNDLKKHFEATPRDISDNLLEMCNLIKEKTDANILLASPMLLGDQIEFSPLHLEFGRQAVDYSFDLAPEIERVAKEVNADFIDLAIVAVVSDVDCLHLVPEEHAKVAQAMHKKVMDTYGAELEREAREEAEAIRKAEEEEAARKAAEEEAVRQAELQRIQEEEEAARKAAEEEAARQAELQRIQEEEEAARKAVEEEAARIVAEEEAARQEALRKIEEEEKEVSQEAAITSMFGDASVSMLAEPEEEEEVSAVVEDSDVLLSLPEDDELDEDRMVQEEARLKVEAILKAAEEEVAKEEALAKESEPEEEEVPLVSQVLAPKDTLSDKEKMLSGKLYKVDSELRGEAAEARRLTNTYNQTTVDDLVKRSEILESLFGKVGKNPMIEPPFRCDYGSNISIGDNFYANFNCTMLDCAKIEIGNNVFFGPSVNVYTPCHPIYAPVRNDLLEYAKAITIGDDVWIGGNVTINPGVTIGSNVVIGAGSVVTKDIPEGVVVAGNPCRVIREISEEDKTYWLNKKAEYDEK